MTPTPITREAVEAMADSYKGSGSGVADMLLALLARAETAERERLERTRAALAQANKTEGENEQ